MRRTVEGVGRAGIVRDIKSQLLPLSVWSDGRNVRFEQNRCFNMGGVVPMFEDPLAVLPIWCGFANGPVNRYLLYSNGPKLYSWDTVGVNEITKSGGDYVGSINDRWNPIEMYNGLAILNNRVDRPQVWTPTAATNLAVALANLATDVRFRALKGFKNFLIGLNVTKGSTKYPHMIKWSNQADPGAIPTSWDHTDPAVEAGEYSFSDTKFGEVVNGASLGNYFYVYKENSIWVMSYVGGVKIFANDYVSQGIGLFIQDSLVQVPINTQGRTCHFFAGEKHFYTNDGTTVTPIFDQVFKNEFQKLANPDYLDRCFSVVDTKHTEVWFAFPEAGETVCTLAFVWNYKDNSYTIKELGGTLSIASGLSFNGPDVMVVNNLEFSDLTLFSDGTGWEDTIEVASNFVMVESVPNDNNLYFLETGLEDYDGDPLECWVERTSLPCIGVGRDGAVIVDYNSRKLVSAVVPKMYSGVMNMEVGVQEIEQNVITWADPISLDLNSFRQDMGTPVSGRFISFRFTNDPGQEFEFGGFDYEVDKLGEN